MIKRLHYAAINGMGDAYEDHAGEQRNVVSFVITPGDRYRWPEFEEIDEITLVYNKLMEL